MFQLRYYQDELIESARTAFDANQSTAIVAATGVGKTEMYLSDAVSEPGRVLVLVHRDYLISQPVERLAAVGFEDVAVEKAEKRAEVGFHRAKIVFASVQSIGPESQEKRLKTFDPFVFSKVIVDEAHRSTAPIYRRVLDHFKVNPRIKILLLTATPNRKDGVALGTVCDSVAGVYGPSAAMDEGWIAPVKFFRRDVKSLDFSNVRLKGSDLDPDQVQALLMQEQPLHEVCSSLAEDRGSTIVFCPEVAIARAYEGLMNSRYRPNSAKMLCAESDEDERQDTMEKLASGRLEYVFNVGLFVEGADVRNLQRVVWAAPTASLVKYVQGVGRVFRPHDSLRKALTGGREDSAKRRKMIADSPKPFGIVVTYYPVNCKHELCDPIDILGGDDLPSDVKAVAKEIQDETSKQGGGSTTADDIETAKVFCDLRAVLDKRRKDLKAKARFTDQEFNPMSGRKNYGEHRDTGKSREAARSAVGTWKGETATEKQLKWYQWKRIATPEGMTKFQASVVRDLIQLGVSPDAAFGYGCKQALTVRGEMQKRTENQEPVPL